MGAGRARPLGNLPLGSKAMKTGTLEEKALHDENSNTQEALRLSEARNRDLVENSIYGIFRVGADGSFLDANPALRRIIGCAGARELGALNLASDIFRFPEQYSRVIADCQKKG